MAKNFYHTYDFFAYDDIAKNKLCFDYCHKIALACGLTCTCKIGDWHLPQLHLRGTKYQFVKYYFRTLAKDHSVAGLKRLLSVGLWK